MITDDQANEIAAGWIGEENSRHNLQVIKGTTGREIIEGLGVQRETKFWFILNEMLYSSPKDALLVLKAAAEMQPESWTLEALGIGPLRDFLDDHGTLYRADVEKLRRDYISFNEMYLIASRSK